MFLKFMLLRVLTINGLTPCLGSIILLVFLYKGVERCWVTPYLILILYAGLKVNTLLVLSHRYVVLQSLEVFHSCFTSILQSVIHSIDIF